jgi:hypothetical protein
MKYIFSSLTIFSILLSSSLIFAQTTTDEADDFLALYGDLFQNSQILFTGPWKKYNSTINVTMWINFYAILGLVIYEFEFKKNVNYYFLEQRRGHIRV